MQMPNHHYTNFLLSIQFDSGFLPNSVSGMVERCMDFLSDMGKLARKNGMRLHASWSVVRGVVGFHAHFGLSWITTYKTEFGTTTKDKNNMVRQPVIDLLEDSFFFVDNRAEAIKRVTHDKPYVTGYIIQQPKDGQDVVASGFYIHEDFCPSLREVKANPYCSTRYPVAFQKDHKKTPTNLSLRIFLLAALYFLMISTIILSLF